MTYTFSGSAQFSQIELSRSHTKKAVQLPNRIELKGVYELQKPIYCSYGDYSALDPQFLIPESYVELNCKIEL